MDYCFVRVVSDPQSREFCLLRAPGRGRARYTESMPKRLIFPEQLAKVVAAKLESPVGHPDPSVATHITADFGAAMIHTTDNLEAPSCANCPF